MLPTGFYINELRVTGYGKKDAIVKFNEGFNLISGLSDTGKSYVFACLKYMLGSTKAPKSIPESNGYTDVYLEISTCESSEIYTIHKNILGKSVSIKRCRIDKFSSTTNIQNKKRTNDSLVSFLSDLSNLDGKKLMKSKSQKVSLLYTYIRKMSVISETQVIREETPFFPTGQHTEKTLYMNLFKYLVTGIDDSDFSPIEKDEIRKSRLNGQILLSEKQISRITTELDEIEKTKDKLLDSDISSNIEFLENQLQVLTHRVEEYTNQKNIKYRDIVDCEQKLSFYQELLDRLILLKKHYKSDLNRLDFIEEGRSLFSQLNTIGCPICDNEINVDKLLEVDSDVQVKESIAFEKNKIQVKYQDLMSTIEDNKKHISESNALKIKLTSEYEAIDNLIDKEFKPQIGIINDKISRIRKIYYQQSKVEILTENLQYFINAKEEFAKQLKEKKVKENSENINEEGLNNYKNYLKNVLTSWKYTGYESVAYDKEKNDFIFSGKQRGAHGKGMRGISYTAELVALIDFCIDNDIPFTKLLVVDSPLTTYHGKEEKTEEDYIDENIERAFFYALSKKEFNFQFIMLDNKQPNDDIKEKINFIQFTKDKQQGRYGFFPIE